MNAIQTALAKLAAEPGLTRQEMQAAMRQIMNGEATPAQIGGLLAALRARGETVAEIVGAAEVMREFADRVEAPDPGRLLDTCGTGGDGARIFNVSTTAALIAAAAGARIAKHGNRSVSGASGSADVLERAGVRLELSPEQVRACIETAGIGFMFAPRHHSAMRHAAGPRRELGMRTLFNLLGPLTNPAGARRQLLGVFAAECVTPVAEALERLGCDRAMVVHSEDGLDEISTAAPTRVAELRQGRIENYRILPREWGLAANSLQALAAPDAERSHELMRTVLAGASGPARDIAVLNAAAALYTAGLAADLGAGVQAAAQAIDDGRAQATLERLARASNA